MNYKKFSLLFGFSVFLMATLASSFWGHVFLQVNNAMVMISLYLAVVPVLYYLTHWVFKRFQLSTEQRMKSAVFMVVPGMLCDVLCLKYHIIFFPTLTIEQAVVLCSWVLWVYVFTLLLGLVEHKTRKKDLEGAS
ncbi:MAG TPA: hypothetical protein DCS93_12530 [Microscillaceae bacterium]|nr:hypothetical protein [Microscillaceae bacterium]